VLCRTAHQFFLELDFIFLKIYKANLLPKIMSTSFFVSPRKDHHIRQEKIAKGPQWLKFIHHYRQLYQYLRDLLMINPLKFLHARRPTTAVNLLHGRRFVQDLLIINRAGLEDLDPAESLALNPHDGPAAAAVVIGDALAGVAGAGEGAVGAG
jgi:hypothetical protein